MKLFLSLSSALGVLGAFSASDYPNKITIGSVDVHWKKIGTTEVQIALKAATTGWIGFGLGEKTSGSMPGADIMVGKVENGVASVVDYYATDKATPTKDTWQHWRLVNGEESGGNTIIEAKRGISTGDGQDRDFDFATGIHNWNAVIVAIGSSDTFSGHSTSNRWSQRVPFGQTNGVFPDPLAAFKADTATYKVYKLEHGAYTIPHGTSTTYKETDKSLHSAAPFTSAKQYIVGFEAIVSSNSKAYNHHMTVQPLTCTGSADSTCSAVGAGKSIYAWVPGQINLAMPSGTGFEIGTGAAWNGLKIQTHFDNPSLTSGVSDTSYVNVYYTATVPANKADMLIVGDGTVKQLNTVIPVGVTQWTYTCPASFFTQDITIVNAGHHAHAKGTQIVTYQSRGGKVIDQWETNYYDWRFEQTQWLSKTVKAGDELKITCVFKVGSGSVKFGLGSEDEMCMDFIMYYPSVASFKTGCGITSTDTTSTKGTAVSTTLTSVTSFNQLQLSDFGKASGANTAINAFSAASVTTFSVWTTISSAVFLAYHAMA